MTWGEEVRPHHTNVVSTSLANHPTANHTQAGSDDRLWVPVRFSAVVSFWCMRPRCLCRYQVAAVVDCQRALVVRRTIIPLSTPELLIGSTDCACYHPAPSRQLPHLLNSLQKTVRASTLLSVLRSRQKTELFARFYSWLFWLMTSLERDSSYCK